jgi:RNA polymerase sigma-70 factor (ECF subfamily)
VNPTDRLSRLSTHWPELLTAQGDDAAAREAQCAVLRRYGGAVYHYLAAATGDPHAAADLAQEFALRFVRGDFHGLDPGRGQFRRFLRTVLYHLAIDHLRARRAAPGPLPPDSAVVPAGGGPLAADDAEFDRRWCAELLEQAWEELRRGQAPVGAPYYEALRWRAEHPGRPTADGAEALSKQLGRPVTAAAYRQTLHRARERFADLLRAEVAFSLGTATPDEVTAELAALGLLRYCPAPDRAVTSGSAPTPRAERGP